jgi:IPT/TIG domain
MRLAICALGILAALILCSSADAANRGVIFEPGDRIITAIDPAADVDTYVFDAVAGEKLTVKVTADKKSDLIPGLEIRDPDGNLIDPGTTLKAKKNKVTLKKLLLAKSGRYALVVTATTGAGGDYVMKTDVQLPEKLSFKAQSFLGSASMDIEFAGATGATVKASFKFKSGSGITVTSVTDPTGTEVPGAVAEMVVKGSSIKGSFALNQGLGTYSIQLTNGADLTSVKGTIKTKFPKPRKMKTVLPTSEPHLASLDPSTAYATQTIALTGENLAATTTVYFGDTLAVSTFVSATEITATVPSGTGTSDVSIFDPIGQGSTLLGGFTHSTVPPAATVEFPPVASKTDATTLTVVGTATSPIGIDAVRVNGVPATTTDGFAAWRVQVPLSIGVNTLTVQTEDEVGNVATSAAEVTVTRTGPILASAYACGLDAANSNLLMVDYGRNMLVGMNLTSGATATYSDDDLGTGTSMVWPWAVAYDAANARAFVLDIEDNTIHAIDLFNGNRTVVTSDSKGSGTDMEAPRDIVYDAAGSRLIVVDALRDSIFGVDVATGDRTVISDADDSIGTGPALDGGEGLCLDSAFGYVLVANGSTLLAVHLSSGNRLLMSDAGTGVGTGIALGNITKVAFDAAASRVIAMDRSKQNIVSITLSTGNRTLIGSIDYVPRDVAWDAAGNRVLIVAQHREAVAGMDFSTGDITWISDLATGSGPELGESVAIGSDASTDRTVVVGRSTVTTVDNDDGTRTLLSGSGTGTGDDLMYLSAGVIDEANRRVIVLENSNGVMQAVDLDTGNRTVLSGPSLGTGPALGDPKGAALDSVGNRVIVLNQSGWGVLAVDLTTGNRTAISDATRGTGPVIDNARGLALDLAGNRALVVDYVLDALIAVDLTTGNRTVLSDAANGTGTVFSAPWAVILEPSGTTALVLEQTAEFLHRVDLATGNRTIASDGDTGSGPSFVQPPEMCLGPKGTSALVANGDAPAIVVVERESGDRVFLTKD